MAKDLDLRSRLNLEILPGLTVLSAEQAAVLPEWSRLRSRLAMLSESVPFHSLMVCLNDQPVVLLPVVEATFPGPEKTKPFGWLSRKKVTVRPKSLAFFLEESGKALLAHDTGAEQEVLTTAWQILFEAMPYLAEGCWAQTAYFKAVTNPLLPENTVEFTGLPARHCSPFEKALQVVR